MLINKNTGLIEGVTQIASPNCDSRPAGMAIDLIVIHCISMPPGVYGGPGIGEFFCNQLDANAHDYYRTVAHLKVSSHLLIDREGAIVQFVPLHLRAWHAGVAQFEGRPECNDFSIGIELEGTDSTAFAYNQYHTLAEVSRLIMKSYPAINKDKIVGHSHIAPARKSDPGQAFDWHLLKQLLE